MMYLSTREGRDDLYPSDPKKRAMVDAANFYTLSIFYPLLTRATYPRLGFAGLSGRGLDLGCIGRGEGGRPQVGGGRAAAGSSTSTRRTGGTDTGFIGGGDSPTIADIRLAATLEFLAVTDMGIPGWAKDYIGRVESALGDAYSEPAGDVRGYVAQVTGEAVAAS